MTFVSFAPTHCVLNTVYPLPKYCVTKRGGGHPHILTLYMDKRLAASGVISGTSDNGTRNQIENSQGESMSFPL